MGGGGGGGGQNHFILSKKSAQCDRDMICMVSLIHSLNRLIIIKTKNWNLPFHQDIMV